MRTALLAALLAASLSHFTWFVRTLDETELAQSEVAEFSASISVADQGTD